MSARRTNARCPLAQGGRVGRAGEVQRFLLKWLRYRPEHDVKLLIKRWELCVVVQWRCSEWMERALVLIIGGQFSGDFSARELKKRFHVTVADAKEFFETTPGVLRLEISGGVFEVKATNGVGWRRYGSRHLATPCGGVQEVAGHRPHKRQARCAASARGSRDGKDRVGQQSSGRHQGALHHTLSDWSQALAGVALSGSAEEAG